MLSKELKQMMVLSVFGFIIVQLTFLFMNLYIWIEGKSIHHLMLFNIGQFLTWGMMYVIGVIVFKKTNLRVNMLIASMVPVGFFYFLTTLELVIKNESVFFMGMLIGLMLGFYTSGQTQAVSNLGKKEEFDYYFQLRSIVEKIVSIFVPVLFSVIIYYFGFKSAFFVLFITSFSMFIYVFKLPKVKLGLSREVSLLKNLSRRKIFKTKKMNLLFFSLFLGPVILEFQRIFALLFTFSVTNNEIIVAMLTVIYSMFMFLAMKIYKQFPGKSPSFWISIGIGFMFLSFIILIIGNVITSILANILLVIGTFFFRNVFYSEHYKQTKDLPAIENTGFFIWRESIFCLSRIMISFLVLLFVNEVQSIAFFVLFLLSIVSSIFIIAIYKKLS